jgi:uncharacterized membrane protein
MVLNGAQMHLLLNHLPVIVPVIGLGVSVLGWRSGSEDTRRIGLGLLVIAAVLTVPTYLTGDPAEDVVKNYPGISRLLIRDHDDAALWVLILNLLSGAIAALILVAQERRSAWATRKLSWWALLMVSLMAIGAAARTAHLGGLIRHEEIRSSDRF